ncbi:MAG: hypothetical protein JO329_22485 [Planctomycetaceae bacterium]|nr:hypothetical protein [Planctomycetaceae bacterium]MBV8318305.1 hypothetical protein [Planctomycetaceae bacterium]
MIPYLVHLLPTPGWRPTGFIQPDMASYMANAREHFDNDRFQLLYGNPFSPSYETRSIYFQPMTLVLGLAWRLSGRDPGLVFTMFGVLAAWSCARVAVALYREVVGLEAWPHWLGLLVFFWGGGLLVLAGLAHSLVTRGTLDQLDLFAFDPGDGWWFLSFGRNLIFPTEALYHALFIGSILCICKRRLRRAAVLALLTSISHPFTGAELLAILVAWAFLEVEFLRSRVIPRRFLVTLVGILAFHGAYYLVFLRGFDEHRQLMEAWKIPWLLEASSFVPAYILVGSLATWSFRRYPLARRYFATPRNRLFLVWFLVAFAMANHEFAIRPIQPLHFTRGYEWMALFLMGANTLITLFAALPRRLGIGPGALGITLLVAILVLDNALWLARFPQIALRFGRREQEALCVQSPTGFRFSAGKGDLLHWTGFRISSDMDDLFEWMSGPENRGSLLLTRDPYLGYLASVYTPLRSWVGHVFNTPNFPVRMAEVEDLFREGKIKDYWAGRTVLILFDRGSMPGQEPDWLKQRGSQQAFRNDSFQVFRIKPTERPIAGRNAGTVRF